MADERPQITNPVSRVVFIYVDDLRPELNCYGRTRVISPNMDKLAARALVFDNAHCQVPQCMASRVSTLSGMYSESMHQRRLNDLLPKGRLSLPGYFKESGYRTVSIGKVYHHNEDDPESWTKRYTDTFREFDHVHPGWSSGYQLKENKELLKYFGGKTEGGTPPPILECVEAPDDAYPDGTVARLAVDELEKQAELGAPLFLAAGFYRPHMPWAVPKKYWDLYRREDIKLPDNPYLPEGGISRNDWGDICHYSDEVINEAGARETKWTAENFPVLPDDKQRELIHGYLAAVSFVDAQIGRVLDKLNELGMTKDTAIVLCGDNGWHLGEHTLWTKVTQYEESSRVPLMVSAPGVAAGHATQAPAELIDLYPTLCSFAGLAIPDHVEGISMLPILSAPQREWKSAAFTIWEGSLSMRTERYRLTRYEQAMPNGGRWQLPGTATLELYDYESDPGGNRNVADEPAYKSVMDELIKQMNAGWMGARPSGK